MESAIYDNVRAEIDSTGKAVKMATFNKRAVILSQPLSPEEKVSANTGNKYIQYHVDVVDILDTSKRTRVQFIEFTDMSTLEQQQRWIAEQLEQNGFIKLDGREVRITVDGQYTNHDVHLFTQPIIELSEEAQAYAQAILEAQEATDA